MSTFEVPLARTDQVALVSPEDAERVTAYGWCRHIKGYACTNMVLPDGRRTIVLLHRFVMGLQLGDRTQIDHRNRDKLDCRRPNLRLVSSGQNRQNLDSYRGSTSAYRGVHWDASRQRWVAQGKKDGKGKHLGRYLTEEEAAEAALRWRLINLPYSEEI